MKYVHLTSRRLSEPTPMDQRPTSPFDFIASAQTDGIIPEVIDNPDMKYRIREWIRDYVSNNTVERTSYFNMLQQFGVTISDNHYFESSEVWDWPPIFDALTDPDAGLTDNYCFGDSEEQYSQPISEVSIDFDARSIFGVD